MSHARSTTRAALLASSWAALVCGCAPHERAQEPVSACAEGMVLVEGGPLGPQTVQRLCVDVTEVTTAAYAACVQAGACAPAALRTASDCNLTRADRGDHPINCTTADQGQAYCAWLGKRLPDDAEWTWVARGGWRNSPYPWGQQPVDDTRACLKRETTCQVGSFPAGASPEGVLDLVGDVAEWTARGQLRGGSWRDASGATAPAGESAEPATAETGFRCVVLPFTPVQPTSDEAWTPYQPPQGELPVLAAPPADHPPTRPLANLGVLLRRPGGGEDRARWWPLGDRMLPLEPADAGRLALQDALDRAALPEALKGFTPLRDLGATVLMTSGYAYDLQFIAVERATAKIRWQAGLKAIAGTTYAQVVAPRTLVASFYGTDADLVLALALDDGRELWRLRGGNDAAFTRVRALWTDGDRGYAQTDRGLMALDPTTGAVLWSGVATGQFCGVATGDDLVVVEDPAAGHRVLDPATGAIARRLASRPGAECRWDASIYDDGVATAVIDRGHLYAFDAPVRGKATLRAVDLSTGDERWRRDGLGPDVLVADHDAVYVARAGEVLVALDAASGETRAELSIGSHFDVEVEQGGGAAGPLVVVDADGTGTWILGRGEAPAVPEVFTVRGRLVAEGIPRSRAAGVGVRVGERKVKTDARGRFEVRGKAVGAVALTLANERGPEEPGGSHVRFYGDPVVLDGSGVYDLGDIALYEWYAE